MNRSINSIIKTYLVPAHDFIFGFADLTGLVDEKYSKFNMAISIGKKLDHHIVDPVMNGPTPEYFTHYKAINNQLALLTENISRELNSAGMETINISPSVSTLELDTIYSKTLRTAFSHKMAATRAGLGWIGRSGLLITKDFGPRLRLVTILCKDIKVQCGKPIIKSRCGKCFTCVEKCPAHAMNGKLWNTGTDRDKFFQAFKCREKCKEFGEERLQMDARVCGICVAVCPIGRKTS